jgi:N-acetylglutamate synthase-like GNAT family acetyltransferase
MRIQEASVQDFEKIKAYISLFELDNRDLDYRQFLVYKKGNNLLGFGRIRNYSNCDELCSLGVIEAERNKGIGKQLVKALIQKATSNLFLVCIIPQYFEGLNFKVTNQYPKDILEKLNYCTNSLVVEEDYVAMKWSK